MIKKLRLLLFEECQNKCIGCCNNDWNLEELPVCKSYKKYNEILLTGGEPFLHPEIIISVISNIRNENLAAKIYIYTSWIFPAVKYERIIKMVDGITLTLHEKISKFQFQKIEYFIMRGMIDNKHKSLRLNIFKGAEFTTPTDMSLWKVKEHIQWIKNSPLPENEEFKRLKRFYRKKDV